MAFTCGPYFALHFGQDSQVKVFFRYPGINGFLGIEILFSDDHGRTLSIGFHLYIDIGSPVVHDAFKGIERWAHRHPYPDNDFSVTSIKLFKLKCRWNIKQLWVVRNVNDIALYRNG